MSCFFSRIKGLLKNDPGGRYLAIILEEILEEDDSIVNDLLRGDAKVKKGSFYVVKEWAFTDRNRFADVAIVNKENNKVIALVEIKYEDEDEPKNAAQLDDYLEYCDENNIAFKYLTKNLPPKNDLVKVGNNYLSYAELVHRIEKRNNLSYVAIMLCKFLREEGYVFQKNIDKNALLLLMVNSLSFPNRHGFGQLNTLKRITKDVPKTFEAILNNTSVLGSRFYEHLAFNVFSKSPRVGYRFSPDININKIKKRLEDGDDWASVERSDVESGAFVSYADLKIPGGGAWVYLTFGYRFELEIGAKNKDPVKCYLFAEVAGSKIEPKYRFAKITIGLGEEQTYKKLLILIKNVLNDVLDAKNSSLQNNQRSILKELRSTL